MKRLFATVVLMFAISSAHAGMIWVAVAVDSVRIDELSRNEELLASTLMETKGEQAIDLDKAWHGIHFLLNGTAWEITNTAGQAVLGGQEFGEDMGYGHPRLILAEDVQKIAKALSTVTSQELSTRYKPQVMEQEEIYPAIIWQRDGLDALNYLLDGYSELLSFYQRAAAKGQAVVLAIM